MKRIMFVCTGNTCRSPMAEIMLRALLKQNDVKGVVVTSAGFVVSSDAMNDKARTALKNQGFKPRKFTPKVVTKELVKKQNAVICMTSEHKSQFRGFTNIYTISELTGMGDIIDPYGQDQLVYDDCCKTLNKAVKIIYDLIMEDEK